ncbi:MAG: ribosome-associated translation inhibitor RaiA [Azospirillaceae bacterium]|nr:ribosome-associated translation inhibitor RaiA [Azospirillaceae bacterium]
MHLSVKGKQLDVGDALRTYVAEHLGPKVTKYFDNSIEATVTFSRVAHLYRADISVHVGRNMVLQSVSEATEPYPAFDTALDKLSKRLSRNKRRLRDHRKAEGTPVESVPAAQYVLAAEVDLPSYGVASEAPQAEHEDPAEDDSNKPVIIAEMTTSIDTLTVSEAVMRLDLGELPALLFRNRAHGELNLVYRRSDGHVGWVDPKGSQGAAA